ncbi:MAG: YggN family protein [Paraglaciecola sp.]|jgi:hypothetical protein|nr:YggN family protein [Paraglaciecola sp.]NCT47660.1 YggN family protein [Paraglaciecola sp.]
MRKLFLASLLALSTQQALAQNCNVEFLGDLQLDNKVITITTDDHRKVVIDANQQLWVDDKEVVLTKQNQRLVEDYYAGFYHVAPQVADITRDALDLAGVAINEVFVELLGSDNDLVEETSLKLSELGEQVHANFYAKDGEIRFKSGDFDHGDFPSAQWEAEFEHAVEQLVEKSIGKIMLAVGAELMFGNGDFDAFEAKMENFGDDIEQRVESRANLLEERAEALCYGIISIDRIETKMEKNISELANFDVLQVNKNKNLM